ncbi:MAG: CPBP family intramembrane metalloprotease [Deltaproteobacteria bacterium]|nr:CPBP family intramembrane metalloprotease [Deltaproteobacteria bacterium]
MARRLAESPEAPETPPRTLQQRLRAAAIVAGIAYAAQAPYLYYLARVAYPTTLSQRHPALTAEQVLGADLIRVAIVVILASLIGALFVERAGLVGLGTRASKRSLLVLFAMGAAASAVIYTVVGRSIAEKLPGQYPCALGWALVGTLRGALFEEVVARYGMMTLLVGITRRTWLANILQAIFFSAVSTRAIAFATGPLALDALTAATIVTSLIVNLIAGGLYAKRGLASAAAFHLGISTRFTLHAVAGC